MQENLAVQHIGALLEPVPEADLKAGFREVVRMTMPLAVTSTTIVPIQAFVFDRPARLIGIKVTPGGALTADDTNLATFVATKSVAATPGTPIAIGTLVTNVAGGSWVAFTEKTVTIVPTTFAAGDRLHMGMTKGGSGVTVPAGTVFTAVVEYLSE